LKHALLMVRVWTQARPAATFSDVSFPLRRNGTCGVVNLLPDRSRQVWWVSRQPVVLGLVPEEQALIWLDPRSRSKILSSGALLTTMFGQGRLR
jgi:hypothetical protein